MSLNTNKVLKIIGFSAFLGKVSLKIVNKVNYGWSNLGKIRQYEKKREERERLQAIEKEKRKAQQEERKKGWEEKRAKMEEQQNSELETVEIKGELYYKNKYGQWCPFKNRSNSDVVVITVSKTKELEKGGVI